MSEIHHISFEMFLETLKIMNLNIFESYTIVVSIESTN